MNGDAHARSVREAGRQDHCPRRVQHRILAVPGGHCSFFGDVPALNNQYRKYLTSVGFTSATAPKSFGVAFTEQHAGDPDPPNLFVEAYVLVCDAAAGWWWSSALLCWVTVACPVAHAEAARRQNRLDPDGGPPSTRSKTSDESRAARQTTGNIAPAKDHRYGYFS